MYQGTDPSDATAWALVGVYNLGYPMGARSLVKYGSDLAIITTDGVIPLSQAIKLDRSQDDAVALTQKIQPDAFQAATVAYPPPRSAGRGCSTPRARWRSSTSPTAPAVQYVQNVQTGRGAASPAWTRPAGPSPTTPPITPRSNAVYQWDIGADDAGTPITYDLGGAWSNFRTPGQKRFTMLRPLMNTVSWITPAVEMDVNYRDTSRRRRRSPRTCPR
jgi:hypothetical protein